MQFAKATSLLFLALSCSYLPLQADIDHDFESDIISEEDQQGLLPHGCCHRCSDDDVILKYKTPSTATTSSQFGVYLSILTINTEKVVTNNEIFRIVKGRKKNVPFRIHLEANQTLVAFVVSFDDDFVGFSSADVGTLTAIVEGVKFPIELTEYEPNTVVGYFNLSE